MLTPRTPGAAPTADEYDAAQARGGGERAPEKHSKREDFYSADKRKAPALAARAHHPGPLSSVVGVRLR